MKYRILQDTMGIIYLNIFSMIISIAAMTLALSSPHHHCEKQIAELREKQK